MAQTWDPRSRTCPQCGAELPLPEEGSGVAVRHAGTESGSVFLGEDDTIIHTCGTLLFSDYAKAVKALYEL